MLFSYSIIWNFFDRNENKDNRKLYEIIEILDEFYKNLNISKRATWIFLLYNPLSKYANVWSSPFQKKLCVRAMRDLSIIGG